MNLPLKALRSKDFPQDRQTKLQNTLTPLPLPTTHTSSPDSLLFIQLLFIQSLFIQLLFIQIFASSMLQFIQDGLFSVQMGSEGKSIEALALILLLSQTVLHPF